MKLHRLSFTAIGPFAGSEVIDFTAFDESGLFLLEGPTGAGKSTIIDAITFALYGDVARLNDASKDRLRSTCAPSSVRSEVELVFEVASGIYRVRRVPSYVAAGNKTPTNVPTTLVRVVEDPHSEDGFREVAAIERGSRQVDPAIRDLIGLHKEQFLQTVVLPQGKFADFLTASSKEREKILSEIFDTSIYRELQSALVSAGAESKTLVDEAERQCASAFQHVMSQGERSESEQTPLDEGVALASDGSTAHRHAQSVIQNAQERESAAKRELPELRARCDTARSALHAATTLNAVLDERAQLNAQKEALASKKDEVEEARVAIAQSRAAAPLIPLLDAEKRALDLRVHAAHALRKALDTVHRFCPELALPQGELEMSWAQAALEKLTASAAQYTQHRHALSSLLGIEAGIPDRCTQADALAESLRVHEDEQRKITESIRALPRTLADLDTSEKTLRTERAALEGAADRVTALNERLTSAESLPALQLRVAECAAATQAADSAYQEAKMHAKRAYKSWLRHTGAALAADLEDGQACPVCGSTSHPHPASPSDETPLTKEDLRALEQVREKAESDFLEAHKREVAAMSDVASAAEHAGASLDELQERVTTASQELARLHAIDEQLEKIAADVASARSASEDVHRELAAVNQRLGEERTRLQALTLSIDEDKKRCTDALDGYESLQVRDEALSQALSQCTNTEDALKEWVRSMTEYERAHAEAARALKDAGVEDSEQGRAELRKRVLTPSHLSELDTLVSTFDADSAVVHQALADSRLANIREEEPVDIAPLTQALAKAEREHEAAALHLGQLTQATKAAQAAMTDFTNARTALEAARTQAGPTRRLAGIVDASSPDNLVATPLSSWALIACLNEVLAAANPRLLAISSGRYELVSASDDGTRSRRLGLGVKILDHETEEERATRTLSGGETFYTSFALALGLADVVASQAGGIELRTLFIDEGFGSLDSATLDLVMTQLHALRQSGRTVGVISHVEEMARQIPDQIRVFRSGDRGSTLSLRV